MTTSDKTSLGDRMKQYEQPSILRRAFKGQPLIARLDGKAFHTFTKGLKRPYDENLSALMVSTMCSLLDRFQATVAYTQSDEITLAWYIDEHSVAEYPFDGRFQKIESLTAAHAAAYFNSQLPHYLPEKAGKSLALFDSRAFVVPDLQEAYHCFLWRQQDATKNAISMAAQSVFSHKSLQGMHGPEMLQRLKEEKGINFDDYPFFFRRGTFAKKVKETRTLTQEDLDRIPERFWPESNTIERSVTHELDIWLSNEPNAVRLLFGAEPTRGLQGTREQDGVVV